MHATHQFFLTERSLYLLVLNGREGGEDQDVEYWLKLIGSFGSESPVLVVLNKIDQHPFDLNYRALQFKYPQVHGFVKTDCKTEAGLPGVRAMFPATWFAIKDELAGMKQNFLSYEKFRELCRANNETDEKAHDDLAGFLHCLGIALNYKDDLRLRDTSVLNPHWVTTGIYKLLNADKLAEHKGVMSMSRPYRREPRSRRLHSAAGQCRLYRVGLLLQEGNDARHRAAREERSRSRAHHRARLRLEERELRATASISQE
jgi:internalin A